MSADHPDELVLFTALPRAWNAAPSDWKAYLEAYGPVPETDWVGYLASFTPMRRHLDALTDPLLASQLQAAVDLGFD